MNALRTELEQTSENNTQDSSLVQSPKATPLFDKWQKAHTADAKLLLTYNRHRDDILPLDYISYARSLAVRLIVRGDWTDREILKLLAHWSHSHNHQEPVAEDFYTSAIQFAHRRVKDELARGTDTKLIDIAKSEDVRSITINDRPLRHLSDEAADALMYRNQMEPDVFTQSGDLVTVAGDTGQRKIKRLTVDSLRGKLTRAANFKKQTVYKNGTESRSKHITPPEDVVRDVLTRGDCNFPGIDRVVHTPLIDKNGDYTITPGYKDDFKAFYDPPRGFILEGMPLWPTQDDARTSYKWLMTELFSDFPIVAGRDNVLAIPLTAVCRTLFSGPCPMFMIDAVSSAHGKSLLAHIIAIILTGSDAHIRHAPTTEEEWAKSILTTLRAGESLIIYDNKRGVLESEALEAALTSPLYTQRILGASEEITVAQQSVWIATGNNLQVGGDMPRRCVWTRLNAKTSRPQDRGGFRHENLAAWVRDHRAKILAHIFTMVRAWLLNCQPEPQNLPRMGGYESWRNVVGGVLQYAGATTFLENQTERESTSYDDQTWEAFLWKLWEQRGQLYTPDSPQGTFTTTAITRLIRQDEQLLEALPGDLADGAYAKSFTLRLGKALSSRVGRIHGDEGVRINGKYEKHAKTWQWQIDTNESLAQRAAHGGAYDHLRPDGTRRGR